VHPHGYSRADLNHAAQIQHIFLLAKYLESVEVGEAADLERDTRKQEEPRKERLDGRLRRLG
jgi:hypothetical protein